VHVLHIELLIQCRQCGVAITPEIDLRHGPY
jgi:hypothetical protein